MWKIKVCMPFSFLTLSVEFADSVKNGKKLIENFSFSTLWWWSNASKLVTKLNRIKFMDTHTHQFSSVQSLSHVQLFETPWISARQASLSITNSWSLPELMSIESVILSNYLILCRPLLLLPAPQSLTEEIWIRLGGCINVIFPVAIYMIVMQDISFRENWSVLRFLCTVSYNCAWS